MELNSDFVQNYVNYKEILANVKPTNQANIERIGNAKKGLENARRKASFVVLSEMYVSSSNFTEQLGSSKLLNSVS